MKWTNALPLLVVLSSLVPGLLIFALRESQQALRTTLNLVGVAAKLILVGIMLWGVSQGLDFQFQLPLVPDGPLRLHGDALSLQFVALSSVLWMATTVYAIAYLHSSPLQSRFFGYFSLCVSATVGVALAGNLVTFLFFYELLTLTTYPLVVHRGTPEALQAGRVYLVYTIGGGTLLLMGTALLHSLVGSPDFAPGGYLYGLLDSAPGTLIVAFALLVTGLGVKAALIPLHGWLPRAMVAPAPVSALLHAVAVVKAGAFGIVRIIHDVFGAEVLVELNLTQSLMGIAAATILFGSLRAMQQGEIKKRLAYSTVSQVSYIILGVTLLGPLAAVGGLVHLVHQGVMKITLFFCAGVFSETLGVHSIREMNGIGRRLPVTMSAFTVGALGMIGIPPIAGFISKWYLSMGALEVGQPWVVWLLVVSGLLNAAYFLPLIYRGWFGAAPDHWPEDRWTGQLESHWMLLFPLVLTAALALLMGLLAGSALSPSGWSRFIIEQAFASGAP
ncbi:complex I subunit 5 family protein [Gilvimarinus sp. F26214L]|uniref:complex I subunit 5 family protein n=1 Tax=Gilvimarinus sp. DZF01 TaxID=3461371 RepID=UPI0040455694